MIFQAKHEVNRTVAGRRVSDAGRHVVVLHPVLGHKLDASANAVAVTLGSTQRDVKPVAWLLAAIHPDFCILTNSAYHNIDTSIAIQIAESAAPVAGRRSRFEPRFFGQWRPLP